MRHTIIRLAERAGPARTGLAPGQFLGSLIGGIFGLIYVEANAGPLPGPWPAVLQIAASVAFAGLAAMLALAALPVPGRGPRRAERVAGGSGFDSRYWLVVAGEAAAIVAGAALLTGPVGLPRAVVAWVSVVVGAHFVVLAAIWQFAVFRYLGAAIAVCGAAGLIAAAGGAAAAVVAATGGVLPGVLLLTAGYWGASTHPPTPAGAKAPAELGGSSDHDG